MEIGKFYGHILFSTDTKSTECRFQWVSADSGTRYNYFSFQIYPLVLLRTPLTALEIREFEIPVCSLASMILRNVATFLPVNVY